MAVLYIGLCRGGPAAQVRHLQWSLPRRQRTPSCSTMCSVHSSMALSARSVRHLRLISIISRQSHVSGEVSLQQVMVRWNPWLTIKARNWTNCEKLLELQELEKKLNTMVAKRDGATVPSNPPAATPAASLPATSEACQDLSKLENHLTSTCVGVDVFFLSEN